MLNLTDDMFVVEAASFVVPYVFEKRAIKPFREFLDDLESSVLEDSTGAINSHQKLKGAQKRRRESDDEEDSDIEVICDETNPQKARKLESVDYFNSPIGSFFIEIGENLVKETVQFDLLKLQSKKLDLERRSKSKNVGETQATIKSLSQNLNFIKETNASFKFKQRECESCNFNTESLLVMAHHLETPHKKNNLFTCNFCDYSSRSPPGISNHVESAHAMQPRLSRAMGAASCANCPYEGSSNKRLLNHLVMCAKIFDPSSNLCPPVDWEAPAKIPKMTRARHSLLVNSNPDGAPARATPGPKQLVGAPVLFNGQVYRPDRSKLPRMSGISDPKLQSTISTPVVLSAPRLPSKVPPSLAQMTFVICEICDGYIQNMEQLRKHLHWIHKIKIHPKMMSKAPPLICEMCQFRFFTDQGLERHLLGSHGLVTTSMQQAALQAEDSGRCPTCGRVYQWKLLKHMARDHGMKLKPAELSYKCSVCSLMFPQYNHFAKHMYCTHKKPKERLDNTPDEDNNNN